jgi:hypothetical protein
MQCELPCIRFIGEMLLFMRNGMFVLHAAYDCGYCDCVWSTDFLETEKDHRYTNGSLPAL